MIKLRRKKHNKRRKGVNKIIITYGWKRNQIEITLYCHTVLYKNYYFDYTPELHKHLLYRSGTMKEKRRVFREQIDYILNYPRTPAKEIQRFFL